MARGPTATPGFGSGVAWRMAIELVLDCADPERLAAFWGPALGYRRVGAAGQYVLMQAEAGGGPDLVLQQVPEAKTVKNRLHLDVTVDDIEAEAARLVGLGARRLGGPIEEHGSAWVPMVDPEGNEFCVCRTR